MSGEKFAGVGTGSSAAHSRLVADCLKDLALMGYAAWPNQTGAALIDGRFVRFGKKGSGDILVLLPRIIDGKVYGIHGEIECKTGDAVQSKKQKTHMRIVRNNGGIYLVVRFKEEIVPLLAAIGIGRTNPAYLQSAGTAQLL